jgi:phage tail-like protein
VDFFEALPASFLAGPFGDASAGGAVVESFELAVERVERKKVAPVRGRVPAPRGFKVEIDGAAVAGVLSASAVGVELLPETGQLPPAARARNLVLACATGSGETLHDWFGELLAGADSRKPISIVLTPRRGEETRTYNLLECWPCRWKAPELRAGGDTYIVEELEFAVERVERG